ncbi:MAG: tetratricopeptide repeat protein [Anaerolineae bacterium]|nr:tetratricopeptide repeat protein [Anaerolineae bacterium]
MSQPVNPYVAGTPLREQKGFFGRQDILEWGVKELCNSTTNALVFFGQRRIGKTTLLLQLQHTLAVEKFMPVYFDLQDQATRDLGEVLADLADTIAEVVGMEHEELERFDDRGRYFQRIFLPELYAVLDEGCRPVLLLDEFDVLDQVVEDDLAETAAAKKLFRFLRKVMTDDPRLAFVFAVGRRAEDLSLDFTSTFKASLSREIWVLDKESSDALVRQAEVNQTLSFTDRAVERILSLTNGHPYLTQLLCQRIWERAYMGSPSSIPVVDVVQVESAVLDALETGEQALIWLWNGLGPAEKIYAAALAEVSEEGQTISEDHIIQVLADHAARLRTRVVELAPHDLVKRRVLEVVGEREYRFAIEMFRRWVQSHNPLRDVKNELDQVNPLADQLFGFGEQFFRQHQWDTAIRYFEDALQRNSRHFRARLYLGEALLEQGLVDDAVRELQQAYELDRDETRLPLARALVAQAKMNERAGNEEGALNACELALRISPNERVAHEIKTAIWIHRGDQAVEQSKLDVALSAYQQAGAESWVDGVTYVQHAAEQYPVRFRTRFHLGEILYELGRLPEAMAELDASLVLYQQSDVNPILDFLFQLIELNAYHFWVRLNLGLLFLQLGRLQESVEQLELAYGLDKLNAQRSLAQALMSTAQAARDAGNWLAVQDYCVRAIQIDYASNEILNLMREAVSELQRESHTHKTGAEGLLNSLTDVAGYRGLFVDKSELEEILGGAEHSVRLLGVVALDPDWQTLAKRWAATWARNPDFRIAILCESDGLLFSKSFTYDTAAARKRRSFRELKFIRDRVTVELPQTLIEIGATQGVIDPKLKFTIEVMHLSMPVSVIDIDGRLFANLWLHEAKSTFEEIHQDHPWYTSIVEYINTYFDKGYGRQYACRYGDEVLELFDHDRIPRGIYPRSSFYDTDYSQLVVWAFIFDREGRLLIHRRSDNAKDNQGMWDKSVGGHVDFTDVDTSRAVLREVIEELFSEEVEKSASDYNKWAVSDQEMIFLGEWRPEQRQWHPFNEIRAFEREWAFFKLRDSQRLYSPRTLPEGTVRRLRVISDVYLFVAGPELTDQSLDKLKNSMFKLIYPSDLKDAMDKALRGEEVPGFDSSWPVPRFTPDLTNTMTGELRDILEDFSQHIQRYVKRR